MCFNVFSHVIYIRCELIMTRGVQPNGPIPDYYYWFMTWLWKQWWLRWWWWWNGNYDDKVRSRTRCVLFPKAMWIANEFCFCLFSVWICWEKNNSLKSYLIHFMRIISKSEHDSAQNQSAQSLQFAMAICVVRDWHVLLHYLNHKNQLWRGLLF